MKLKGRDLINVGIYGAIYFVILFAVAMLGMIPIFLPLLSVLVPILGGIPFMLFLTKVKKPGMIFIFAMIMGILMLLTGMGPWPLLTCAVAGLLSELCFKSGAYKSAKKAVLSYGLFSMWIFGNYLPLFTDYEGYFAQRADYGQAYIDAVQKLMPLWMAPVLLIACFVCGLLGGLLGRALLKKARRGFLDPRTKLALVLILALFVMGGLGGEALRPIKTALSALPFALLLVERQGKRFLRGVLMLAVGYGLLFALPYLPGVLNFLALMCGGILTRFVVTVVMGEYLIASTSVSEFISAMERIKMPQAITIPMSVMFRLFPTIGAEWRSIRRAMRMRGIHLGGAKATQVLEYQLVPMMTSTVRIGEELSASALTRGLGGPVRRTNICRIGFRAQDFVAGSAFGHRILSSWPGASS